MFTGLVEGMGVVADLQREVAGIRLTITPPPVMTASAEAQQATSNRDVVRLGDSIAINGCCLTVVEIAEAGWVFQAGTETLSKTNLGTFQVGTRVNLERSLPVNGRLGGHFVQGHVDGTAVVADISQEGDWTTIGFAVSPELAALLVPKGSVTVDGVSLTVVEALVDRFSVALIPHTLEVTTLGQRKVRDVVNLENDILGKYAQKFFMAHLNR